MTQSCPICNVSLRDPLPSSCPQCNWDLEHDIALTSSLAELKEGVIAGYRDRLSSARTAWNEKCAAEQRRKEREEQADEAGRLAEQGRVSHRAGRYEEALQYYRRAQATSSDISVGEQMEELETLIAAQERGDEKQERILRLLTGGKALLRDKNYIWAIDAFERLLLEDPNNKEGRALLLQSKTSKVENELRAVHRPPQETSFVAKKLYNALYDLATGLLRSKGGKIQ